MKNKIDRGKDNLVKRLKLQCKNVQSDRKLKSARGITLVALVVTIIIIIILASITMNMAFGDNGLMKQAQLAKDYYANDQKYTGETMINVDSYINKVLDNALGNEIDNPTDPDPEEPDPEPEPGPGEEIPEGTITFGEVVWSGYRASVEVSSSALNSTETKYTIQYQVNGTAGNQWKTINSGESVENLYHGDKVYARITDGEKESQAQEKQVLDTKAPAKAVVELNKETLTAGDTLTAKVTHIDNESGVNLAQSKWIMNQTASEIGTETGNYTGTFSSNGETINLDSKTTGEYYLHILTVDKGGNKTELISNKITIGSITGTVQQKGETTWSGGHASIELETTETQTQYTIEYKINSGSWASYSGEIGNLSHGDKVTARLTNGTVAGPETTIEIKDENKPVVIVTAGGTTTNSVTVSVSASDNESGMTENVTYTYYIKKTSEGDGSYSSPSGATNISQTNYTFTNLDQGTGYDVKVEAKADKAGNIGTGSLLNQKTATIGGASEGLTQGNIVAGPVTWSGGKASTTLTTNSGLQIQYQINTTTEGKWQVISSGGTVGNLNHGDTVFARLYDGRNHGDYASVNILDGIAPTVQISVGETTYNSIQVSVTANDGQSGLATSNTYKYYLNNSLKKTTTETSYTFEGLTAETSYEIKVEAYDKANNKGTDTENVSTKKATVSDAIGNGQFGDTTKIEDDSGDEVWIPGGFEIADDSATDADDGIVIQDSKGNQFVWIPVDETSLNEMYQVSSRTKLTGVTTTTNMYSKLRIRSDDESDYTAGAPNSTNVREPDVLSSYDTSSSYYSILGYGSTKDMADGIVDEYTATYNSIKKYKGFYIGRYELTGSVSSPTVQKGKEVLASQNWYNLKKACTNVVSSSYAQSTMIYGNQWDEVMDWLIDTGAKTRSEVNSNSRSWGNYSNSTGEAATNSGEKGPSGYNEAWQANNIYDLAGNCWEWTQEASNTDSRVGRGGGFLDYGSSRPASDRNSIYPSYSINSYSSRPALYIK